MADLTGPPRRDGPTPDDLADVLADDGQDDLLAGDLLAEAEQDDLLAERPPAPARWRSRGGLWTAVLLLLMLSAAVGAAIMVTPAPDELALQRPDGADVVLAGGAPLSWDPAAISDSISAMLVSQLYEGLTALDADAQVRPALAESWRVEDDGRRIVFDLRDGLTFSDGSPLDAEDVRRSWLRVIDPERPSPLSSLLDDVRGAAAYTRGEVEASAVGITADGQTLRVDFDRPASYFPSIAAVPSLAVVPDAIDDAGGAPDPDELPVSGAYLPEPSETRGALRFAANPRYWAGPPAIERVTVVTDDGGRSSVDVFEDGAVDWTRVSPADAAWIRYDRALGPQLRLADELVVAFLGFDTSAPPFDDARVRRAMAMAVDWRRLAELTGEADELPTSLVPPGIPGRGSGDYLLPHDPEAARAELAEAGYAGGAGFPPVTLATYGVGATSAVAAELARELGIEVEVEVRPFTEHSAVLEADTPDMWTMAWGADFPHAHDFLGLLLRSGSSANVGDWSDPAYDALIDAAAATDDTDEQDRIYGEAQDILREQAPLIPMGYEGSWSLSRDGLRGANLSGVGGLRFADLAWED